MGLRFIFVIYKYNMATFTSTLPDDLLKLLHEKAIQLNLPKNKLIEKALSIYLNQINRVEYIQSYQQMESDSDVLSLAEEGMQDYLKQVKG